jgi:hypothetical protein
MFGQAARAHGADVRQHAPFRSASGVAFLPGEALRFFGVAQGKGLHPEAQLHNRLIEGALSTLASGIVHGEGALFFFRFGIDARKAPLHNFFCNPTPIAGSAAPWRIRE